jgi:hypothetical protein
MAAPCSKCGGDGPFPTVGRICKKCTAVYHATWHQQNRERTSPLRKIRDADYRHTHPEKHVEKVRRWQKRNPQKVVGYVKSYRQRQRQKRQQQKEED